MMMKTDILDILAILAVTCIGLIGVSFTTLLVVGIWRSILNVGC